MGNGQNDKKILRQAELQKFANSCVAEFNENISVIDENFRKVKALGIWSYLPNLVSIATASFFLIYLLQDYPIITKVILILVLSIVIIGLEAAKRLGLKSLAKKKFSDPVEPYSGLLFSLAIVSALSMTSSYIGGDKIIKTTSTPPQWEESQELADLKAQYKDEKESQKNFEATTWKGRITRQAMAGVKESQKVQKELRAKIDKLHAEEKLIFTGLMEKHEQKTFSFGIVLGVIACFADVILYWLLWQKMKLRKEVQTLISRKGLTTSKKVTNDKNNVKKKTQTNGTSLGANIKKGIGYVFNEAGTNERNCEYCGTLFTPTNARQRFCKSSCRVNAHQQKKRESII